MKIVPALPTLRDELRDPMSMVPSLVRVTAPCRANPAPYGLLPSMAIVPVAWFFTFAATQKVTPGATTIMPAFVKVSPAGSFRQPSPKIVPSFVNEPVAPTGSWSNKVWSAATLPETLGEAR